MYVLYARNVKGKCFTDTMLVCVRAKDNSKYNFKPEDKNEEE